jgi:hypothetical protein
MKSRLLLLVCLTFGVMHFCAAYSRAADLTFYVGGVNPGSINYNDLETPLDSSPMFGFRAAHYFVSNFGFEHTFAFSSDYLFPRSLSDITEANGFVYNSNLIVNIPVGIAVPYVTAGAGLVHQYGDENLPVGTKFAFNYGGGLKFPHLAGPLGLRFDLRGYRAGFSDKVNMFEFSGGVLISLGK